MIRLTTKSDAVYHLDEEKKRVTRTGPHSSGIDYDVVPDGEWHHLTGWSEPVLGERMEFSLVAGKFRITTSIIAIEEEA